MIDRLRQMAIFVKVIDHGSFRGAASELALSPSVVSHHISQLEEHLGVALIYRTTRKLTLTRQGETLLTATRKMLDAVEGELHSLTASADVPSGQLKIAAGSVLSKSNLTEMLAEFLNSYPRIGLTVDFSDERKELIQDGFDIAIRMSLKYKKSAATKKLFQLRRALVASPKLIKKFPTPKQPSDLADWPWLTLSPVFNEPFSFAKNGTKQLIRPQVSDFSCNDVQAIYRMARAGAGVAVVPQFLLHEDAKDAMTMQLFPDWELPPLEVYAQWPTNAPRNGLIKLLVKELSQAKWSY